MTMIGDQSPLLDDSGSYDQFSSSMIKVSKTSSALLDSFSENIINLTADVADKEPTNVQANENDNEDGNFYEPGNTQSFLKKIHF
jgi:hypothetical protein